MRIKATNFLHVFLGILLITVMVGCARGVESPMPVNPTTINLATEPPLQMRSVNILVDDFQPQPYQGQPVYFFNRLDGDRGALNNSLLNWGIGQVTTTIAQGNSWGGVWMSLNHPIREGLSVNFSALLPGPIRAEYQSQVTGITVQIAGGTPGTTFRLELKDGEMLSWKQEIILQGGEQILDFDLPVLGNINQLIWVLDHAGPGDFVTLKRVSLTAITPVTDTATAAFVWSYGMLLNNWNPETGLVRDKARDASGEFDAIQATGSLAAATAVAFQLGIIGREDALQIVDKIGDTVLNRIPRYHGLLPHWVKALPNGQFVIVEGTEWSSVDTVIAALGLLDAQAGLARDTSGTEQLLKEIDWSGLVIGMGISHGYTYAGGLIPYAWDVFGGESWLVELAYAGATGQIAPLAHPAPHTANGSGFIDELAWLFVEPPPEYWPDVWGADWTSYRRAAAATQVGYYHQTETNCFSQLGLFGLSASEVPVPSAVPQEAIYQAFGVKGQFTLYAVDGKKVLGAPVVVPHYSAMIATLHPEEAIKMWDWLIEAGYLSPLNNIESLMFPENSNCNPFKADWNSLKGSWNLALQTLGWGNYLIRKNGALPNLWQATKTNPFISNGYQLLVPAVVWRECEYPDDSTTGTIVWRSGASIEKVHGQFSGGYVEYNNINIPATQDLHLKLRYSKYSSSSVPIRVYLDDERTPRAEFLPADQGNWDSFAWTEPIPIGNVEGGIHTIKFAADGQQYGVADLDLFILAAGSTQTEETMPTFTEQPNASNWSFQREAEYPDEKTIGQTIQRSNASALNVHGQFGTTAVPPWNAQAGFVRYMNIESPQAEALFLKIRYSKYSSPSVPIQIYLDDETTPRAVFLPQDQGDWNNFAWSGPIPLRSVRSGTHSITFSTDGQSYGVADLDVFILSADVP